MPKYLVCYSFLAMFAACQSTGGTFPIDYTYEDNQEEHLIVLRFQNNSDRSVCLTPTQWPNAAGKLNQAEGLVNVIIGDLEFSVVDFNTGYCAGCQLTVKAGELATAAIPYADFGIPSELFFEPKALKFEPVGAYCN